MDSNNSSGKTAGLVIVIIIIIAGLWLMLRNPTGDTVAPIDTNSSAQSADTSENTSGSSDQVGNIEASGTTNEGLMQDSASIDAEIEAFASESASANETVQ